MSRSKGDKPARINRLAKKLAKRSEKIKAAARAGSKPMRRKELSYRPKRLIAYDLETTRIAAGETPRPLYITAYASDWTCSTRVQSIPHLLELLAARFLVEEFSGARFVAWNGNNFDVYLVAMALLDSPEYTLRPYLTRSKNLRGLRVLERKKTPDKNGRMRFRSWEFLDGIAMTGLVGTTLKKFLQQFAPEFGKLDGPDFEGGQEFDAQNADHVRYAERDSEGLFHALVKVESIVHETFGASLQPTVGNLGIKIFMSALPANVTVWKPSFGCLEAVRNQVLRGGFCFVSRKYSGPMWKYDINQAYAAAMRDAKLPAGSCMWNPPTKWKVGNVNPYAKAYICHVRGSHPKSKAPFYCRNMAGEPVFATVEIPETWITSIEYKQLTDEGAKLEVLESYFWDETFSMKAFVDRCEHLRMNSPGGPSGPQGTIVKMIGNNAYGKTVERLDGLEILMALDCPEGYSSYQAENDQLKYVWYRFAEPVTREYHQPQIGAFITAHVRMVLRRAILLAPDHWLQADTDCAGFSVPVPGIPIDPGKYGFWKIEESGTPFYVIGKKVYSRHDGTVKHAKGMNVKRLTAADFEAWFKGSPPKQVQVHRQNFVKFATGGKMFTARERVGQRVSTSSK